MTESCFVALDFHQDQPGKTRLFRSTAPPVVARCAEDVLPCLQTVENVVRDGGHAVGFITYDAASAIDPDLLTPQPDGNLPLLWFLLCDEPVVTDDLPDVRRGDPGAAVPALDDWQFSADQQVYDTAFDQVMQHLRDGETYQINLSFRACSQVNGSVTDLYRNMRQAQRAKFCAWIHSDDWDILSASPELFLDRRDQHLVTRPMKGTRPRGLSSAADIAIAGELQGNDKDRAENVMIVDLLRNDLGRVAELGSVRVTDLFRVERYPTIWQMTSTVEADLRPEVTWTDILRATFPCGSVTGAPKVRTMEIITDLELVPRNVYCGTIGWLRPGGDGTFNVAIRTLTIDQQGQAIYPIGSGLVADSDSAGEYRECLLKAAVLGHRQPPPSGLIETMRFEPGSGIYLLERHFRRLQESADYFGFEMPELLRSDLQQQQKCWTSPTRVRVVVEVSGSYTIETAPLPVDYGARPVTVALATVPVDIDDVFLYHKTTSRSVYERAAVAVDTDDVILFNKRGEITETSIANIAIQTEVDGDWLTPPIACGLLSGTMREELLARGELQEGIIQVGDLHTAAAIKLFNSVRGEYSATVISD